MSVCFQVEPVQWTFEDIDSSGGELNHLADFLAKKQFDLVINLPMRNGGARRVSSFMTHGYRTRRLAVDYSVPLITDVKCTKLLVLVCALQRALGAGMCAL
jgi:carbamoyl-phosphate synthase/aspartate carbamoyltransferase/dihydroorotase